MRLSSSPRGVPLTILVVERLKRLINQQHHILDMLSALRVAIDVEAERIPNKKGYFILQLNYKEHSIKSLYFQPSDVELANKTYDHLESKRGGEPLDIVLVRAASFATVKEAYPNYFLDIGEFVDLVKGYLR